MANRHMALDTHILNIQDLKESASKKLPKAYREYYNEGAGDLITLNDNEEAYNRYKIRPRVLINVDDIDTSTTLFGCKTTFPLGFAPTAFQKLAHPDGEVATSRAAARNTLAMGLSSWSTTNLEEVAQQGKGNPYFMQVSLMRDRTIAQKVIRRAEKAGFKAIFLTVDVPVLGNRLNEHRNAFTVPLELGTPNLAEPEQSAVDGRHGSEYDCSIEWSTTIPWIRQQTKMEIWLKGVSVADDVVLAIRHGIDGVCISNHGGRQLDGVPSTLDALRECAPAATGKIQIAVDGGIRRGSDIFKALALGAQHVFVGRVPIWGLGYKGEDGVDLAVKILLREFQSTMALAGCKSVKEINKSHLSLLGADGILSKL